MPGRAPSLSFTKRSAIEAASMLSHRVDVGSFDRRVTRRPESHSRLDVAEPKPDRNSCQFAMCTPADSSPSGLNWGSTITT
jgi:hypothetical protein